MIKKSTSFFLQILKVHLLIDLSGKMLSFDFYPKAVYFEYKFWISWSAMTHIQNRPIGPQGLDPGKSDINLGSLA